MHVLIGLFSFLSFFVLIRLALQWMNYFASSMWRFASLLIVIASTGIQGKTAKIKSMKIILNKEVIFMVWLYYGCVFFRINKPLVLITLVFESLLILLDNCFEIISKPVFIDSVVETEAAGSLIMMILIKWHHTHFKLGYILKKRNWLTLKS